MMKIRWHFTLLALCAVTIAGCPDDRTVFEGGDGILLVGNFPGDQTIDHFVGDDGRAFNNRGAKINKGLQVFWNCANGDAIVLYIDAFERLWAHHWNGTSFTPAVELRGQGQQDLDEDETDDDYEVFLRFRVVFLNTSGHADGNARARNGDALILWSREDEEPSDGDTSGNGLDPDADDNDRLYGTYFDVSARGTPLGTNPDIHYGFNTHGVTIDFDNKRAGEIDDDDVERFGFVSDSLKFTHAFDLGDDSDSAEFPYVDVREGSSNAMPPATRSGDPTNYVFFVWNKAQMDDSLLAGGPGQIADRWHWLEFDLTQSGNALPVQTATGQNTMPLPAGVVIPDGSNVDDEAVVHNGCMIWRAPAINATGLFLSCFTAGAAPTTVELSASVQDTVLVGNGPSVWAGTNPQMPSMHNVYGGDHGLTSLYAFFETFGGTAEHLACAQVPLDGALSREILPIEAAGGGLIEDFDGTRIGRDGDWILAVWRQNNGTIVVGADAQLAGPAPFNQIHVNAVQTRQTATARDLTNAVAGAAPIQNNLVETSSPSEVFFQSEIADGTHHPRSGFQSNRHRINFCWHERVDSLQSLFCNGVTVTLSSDPLVAPFFGTTFEGPTEGLVGQTDTRYDAWDSDSGMAPVLTDLGTPDGAPLAYFVANANNPTDQTATGSFDEVRVFGNACLPTVSPATARVVSTDGSGQDNTISERLIEGDDEEDATDDFEQDGGMYLRVRSTPSSMAAGNHAGTRVHLFMRESHGGITSIFMNLVTRAFNKGAFNSASAAATFVTAHAPSLTGPPTGLIGPNNDSAFLRPVNYADGDEVGTKTAFSVAAGERVAIYFVGGLVSAGHFYFQEFDGTSWMTRDGGVPDPQLVDNVAGTALFFGRDQQAYAFASGSNTSFDDLSGVMAFWSSPLADVGHRRWFVRIAD